jgi:steroid 5-alpha reductase family enzyme
MFLADVLGTLVIFGFSRWHANSSFYDPYWTVIPPLMMLGWMATGDSISVTREFVVLALILYWATRLTTHWAYYWPGLQHEDWRYPMLRGRAKGSGALTDLLGIHVFPTVQVFLGMLPVYAVTHLATEPLGWLDLVAAVVTFGAITLQMAADFELHAFAEKSEPGDILDTGLWSVSRHPNYLGEIGLWVGLALFGIAAFPAGIWWCSVGAIAMILMFRFFNFLSEDRHAIDTVIAQRHARFPVGVFSCGPRKPSRWEQSFVGSSGRALPRACGSASDGHYGGGRTDR